MNTFFSSVTEAVNQVKARLLTPLTLILFHSPLLQGKCTVQSIKQE